jgi:NAD(P)H-dependent FMN reductase
MSHISVILGSTRAGRFGERPARWIASRLKKKDGFEVELLDLRDFPLPFYAEEGSPARAPRKYRTPEIERWGQKVDRADGFVLVTPEYNHGYSAVLKNAIDYLFVEWRRKPAAFVSYGGVGGARAVEQLRLVTVELEMAPLRHALHVLPATMMEARSNPQVSDDELFHSLEARADLLVDDLAWWTATLAAARAPGP